MRTSIHSEPPENTRHSRTQWFTAYNVISPVIGFLATVAGEKFSSRRLDTSTEVSGPHAFAVRRQALSSEAQPASIASSPASVTIAIRPFVGWTAGLIG
jgi:hypothetical protein